MAIDSEGERMKLKIQLSVVTEGVMTKAWIWQGDHKMDAVMTEFEALMKIELQLAFNAETVIKQMRERFLGEGKAILKVNAGPVYRMEWVK